MKTAIIFGATSGLGWKLAELMISKGWNVLCFGRRQTRLDGFRALLPEESFSRCATYCGDITKRGDIKGAISLCLHIFGSLECAVVSAGSYVDYQTIDQIQAYRKIMEINLWSYITVVQELHLLSHRDNIPLAMAISSTLSKKVISGSFAYSFSKCALENFVKLSAGKESPHNKVQCVTCVVPPFLSEMNTHGPPVVEKAAAKVLRQMQNLLF